ncbi:hypothetical protein ABVT39_025343 [Epinephelus coioides]
MTELDQDLPKVRNAKYFTSMDVALGFWTIPVHVADRHKLAFTFASRQYTFTRCPFVDANSPAEFNIFLNKAFPNASSRGTLIYVDNILKKKKKKKKKKETQTFCETHGRPTVVTVSPKNDDAQVIFAVELAALCTQTTEYITYQLNCIIYRICKSGHFSAVLLTLLLVVCIISNEAIDRLNNSHDCGVTNLHTVRIPTDPNAPPTFVRQYKIPLAAYESIQEILDKLLEKQIIRECNSTYNSPIWSVLKPTSKSRLTIDYRLLNKQVPLSRLPMIHLDQELAKLATAGAKLALAKGQWCRNKVEYVGLTVGTNGIESQSGRIRAIQNIAAPTNVSELRSFLGVCNYSRQFVEDYAEIARPLTELLRKDKLFEWREPQEQSFQQMKEKLCAAPCLAYPDKDKEFHLEASFSLHCLSAALAQKHDTDKRVVAYASRPLSSVEMKFFDCEKALLATVWAVEHFRSYNGGQKVLIETSHQPVTFLNSQRLREGRPSTSVQQPVVHHVACQTDQPVTCTVGTQLSMRTLQPHFRSTGTQKSVSCTDVGLGTSTIAFSTSQPFLSSTPIQRPRKRARLELEEEEEENPLEGSSSMDIPDPKDSSYDPEDSVTVLTESADVT